MLLRFSLITTLLLLSACSNYDEYRPVGNPAPQEQTTLVSEEE
ncbi:hypothetical protein ACTFQF_10545 [Aliivibrio fischeri]|uniref:Lipoprotein n=4 Tax=Aliivibrio fischeri TaxID=668 RepID=B1WN09_ALIF1|nr:MULTISPECIES: hypothetical protein [Aliivibrio]ACB55641.1 hypothetical protein VF_2600 [Aliivibrio fischeri ES114]ACH66739.1 lipoprotein, putative [Aliivibrio fischeri MJ11]EHN70646.1 lipoprotein [Aliivibrio fischeri SR5]KLU80228.1 hypothetical protein AB192_05945 [Aliivibrio fischeri]MUH95288.1 hypothetical protein [Aliivibrio fischeri]